MIHISDEDIQYAERIFLPSGCSFDEERREAIRSLVTTDIMACPGSGKTTVLLAKLAILARKLPLDNNRGICVLTHTNVAIDEIRARLGTKGNRLHEYPNFFGTIQSFVNQYLARPFYSHLFGSEGRLTIENGAYFRTLLNEFRILPQRERYALEMRYGDRLFEMLAGLTFSTDLSKLINSPFKDETCDSALALYNVKWRVLEQGVLSYADAYSLAFALMKYYRAVISKRFAYLFMDETQDTNRDQQQILEEIFDKDLVIVQRIGDPNQAIYSRVTDFNDGHFLANNNDEYLTISGSMRFSCSIAEQVQKLCMVPQEILGNSHIPSIAPRVIVFDDANIDRVIGEFARLIVSESLLDLERQSFKAVGLDGKEHESRRTIPNYWPQYSKNSRDLRRDFDTLIEYLEVPQVQEIQKEGSNYYFQTILRALLRILMLSDNSEEEIYSSSALERYLSHVHPELHSKLRYQVACWWPRMHGGEQGIDEVVAFVRSVYLPTLKMPENDQINAFLTASQTNDDRLKSHTNILNFDIDGRTVDVEVDTVHSCKGETHSATLYLETYWYRYDVVDLMEYLIGNWKRPAGKQRPQRLKAMFVGISRPTHLLCVAAHESTINGFEQRLEAAGWKLEWL